MNFRGFCVCSSFGSRRGLLMGGGGPGGRVLAFGRRPRVGSSGSGRGWCFHVKVQGSARSQLRRSQAVPAANLVGGYIKPIGNEIHGVSRAHPVSGESMRHHFTNPRQGCVIARRPMFHLPAPCAPATRSACPGELRRGSSHTELLFRQADTEQNWGHCRG